MVGLILLGLIADIETICISHHLKPKWHLHVFDITKEQFVEVAASVNGDSHLDLLLRSWGHHTVVRLKLGYYSLWIIKVFPFEVGG